MKKNVSMYDIDKGMKNIWNVTQDMESSIIGDNLYLFSFKNECILDRVLNNQPWNFWGALMVIDRTNGDACPNEIELHNVPF